MGQRVFKVGDRVVVTKPVESSPVGKIGYIREICLTLGFPYYVWFDDIGSDTEVFTYDEISPCKHIIVKEIIDDL